MHAILLYEPGGRYILACELINLRAHKFSILNKNCFFQCMSNILPMHWNMYSLLITESLWPPRFTSLCFWNATTTPTTHWINDQITCFAISHQSILSHLALTQMVKNSGEPYRLTCMTGTRPRGLLHSTHCLAHGPPLVGTWSGRMEITQWSDSDAWESDGKLKAKNISHQSQQLVMERGWQLAQPH